jgi:hypothetical protein
MNIESLSLFDINFTIQVFKTLPQLMLFNDNTLLKVRPIVLTLPAHYQS